MKTFKTIDEVADTPTKPTRQKLSTRQIKFIGEILKGRTQVDAAKKAGYSTKAAGATAQKIMASKAVKAAIDEGKSKLVEKLAISAEQTLTNIQRIAAKAEEVGDYGNALRGNEMIGKHFRLFVDRVEHSGNVNLVLDTGIRREPKDITPVIDMESDVE